LKPANSRTPPRKKEHCVVVIWEFHVYPSKRRKFELAYGPNGEWVGLFHAVRGYIRTTLIRDLAAPNRYLTLDYWQSRRDYESFRQKNAQAYSAIDRKCEALTSREIELGWFTIES
jgi:heme-degrading monooxygenase HmoA